MTDIVLKFNELDLILDFACNTYGVDKGMVKGRGRYATKIPLVPARRLYAYLAKRYTRESLVSVGSLINRDHATILNYHRKISNFIDTDKAFFKWLMQTEDHFKETLLTKIDDQRKTDYIKKNHDLQAALQKVEFLQSYIQIFR